MTVSRNNIHGAPDCKPIHHTPSFFSRSPTTPPWPVQNPPATPVSTNFPKHVHLQTSFVGSVQRCTRTNQITPLFYRYARGKLMGGKAFKLRLNTPPVQFSPPEIFTLCKALEQWFPKFIACALPPLKCLIKVAPICTRIHLNKHIWHKVQLMINILF
jgi:hypothetical protein